MNDFPRLLPDEDDTTPMDADAAPSHAFVAEGMAFAGALLGAGLLLQALLG